MGDCLKDSTGPVYSDVSSPESSFSSPPSLEAAPLHIHEPQTSMCPPSLHPQSVNPPLLDRSSSQTPESHFYLPKLEPDINSQQTPQQPMLHPNQEQQQDAHPQRPCTPFQAAEPQQPQPHPTSVNTQQHLPSSYPQHGDFNNAFPNDCDGNRKDFQNPLANYSKLAERRLHKGSRTL